MTIGNSNMKIQQTPIPGVLIIENDLFPDDRGVFWESFQKEKLVAEGFPQNFQPVQINFVKNNQVGVLRGIHAEPWEKYVSVITGTATGVYVDLRKGDSFGKVVYVELKPGVAVFLPAGIGNSYQTTEDNTYYVYAVSGHWKAGEKYIGVSPFDPTLAINWPIGKDKALLSEKDALLPGLSEITPL